MPTGCPKDIQSGTSSAAVCITTPDYEKDGIDDDEKEEDAAGYTNRERASLQIIAEANVGPEDDDDDAIGVDNDEDDNSNDNDNVEK